MSKTGIDLKFKAEGRCRLCLRAGSVRKLTRHRLVPGHAGGLYVSINCVPLCRPCHDLVDHRERPVRRSARRMLRASLWPSEVAYARRWRGRPGLAWKTRGWDFEEAYPRPPREVVLERRTAVV